jgi:hypothetical protein
MTPALQLERSTILAERPFTHPAKSLEDVTQLRALIDKLRGALPGAEAAPSPGVFVEWQGADPPDCRIVIANANRLRAPTDLYIVGFFGQKRAEADPTPLDAVDGALIAEFTQHPGVLSYCSGQLADGNWGNLVVLTSPAAREHWRTSERHAYAVRDLTPGYYGTIRLHNGLLPGGLFSGHNLILQRTKYYDFHDPSPWYAIREF